VLRGSILGLAVTSQTMSQGKSIPSITALSHFHTRLPLLQQFIAREGHARVPLEHQEDGLPLGYWCSNWRFRMDTAPETIPPEQVELLRQVGFLGDVSAFGLPQMMIRQAEPVAKQAADTPEEAHIGIPAEWMQRSQEKPSQEVWTLPVGCLRPAIPNPTSPKVAFKKRRWLDSSI
jgi:hypothetical protein